MTMRPDRPYVACPQIAQEAFLSALGFASAVPEHHVWARLQYERVIERMMQPRGDRIYATHGYVACC